MSSARGFKNYITLRLYWKERTTTKKLETQSCFGRQIVRRSIPLMCDSAHSKDTPKIALTPLHRSFAVFTPKGAKAQSSPEDSAGHLLSCNSLSQYLLNIKPGWRMCKD
jgi:hypothetical protein